MRVWEMIKELTENPDKKFICTNYDWLGVEYPHQLQHNTVACFGGKIHLDNAGLSVLKLSFATMNAEWQEVIEPVDFLTAYKDCLENGTQYNWYPDGEAEGWYAEIYKDSDGVQIRLDESVNRIYQDKSWKKVSK